MPSDPTNRLLALAARNVLGNMGLRRKGQTRSWFDDHDWWVIHVNFQHSQFSKGSYLNVGISWLWDLPHMATTSASFDFGGRLPGGETFESEEQWEEASRKIVDEAAEEVRRYRSLVPDLQAAASVTDSYAVDHPGWAQWHAAVANGLAGHIETSVKHFTDVEELDDDRAWWTPARLQAAIWKDTVRSNHGAFVEQVAELVCNARSQLRLPRVDLLLH